MPLQQLQPSFPLQACVTSTALLHDHSHSVMLLQTRPALCFWRNAYVLMWGACENGCGRVQAAEGCVPASQGKWCSRHNAPHGPDRYSGDP